MKVFHCPNEDCQKIVFKNHNKYLPAEVDIELLCFHCGQWIRITTENNIMVKKLVIIGQKEGAIDKS